MVRVPFLCVQHLRSKKKGRIKISLEFTVYDKKFKNFTRTRAIYVFRYYLDCETLNVSNIDTIYHQVLKIKWSFT